MKLYMMAMVSSLSSPPCSNNKMLLIKPSKLGLHKIKKGSSRPKWECKMAIPSTYSSRIMVDIPLYESSWASFDTYLEEKQRVFEAIFPLKLASHQLSEEQWRVHMLPIEFLFLKASPVLDMRLRCKSQGLAYPTGVPTHASKVLVVDCTKSDIHGLGDMKPAKFSVGFRGTIYPNRQGSRSKIVCRFQINLSFVPPSVMNLVPGHVIRDVTELILRTVAEEMKDKAVQSLTDDYGAFKREKSRAFLNENMKIN